MITSLKLIKKTITTTSCHGDYYEITKVFAKMNATVTELTAWANMRLTSSDVSCKNILTGLMEGERTRVLVESVYIYIYIYMYIYNYVCLL